MRSLVGFVAFVAALLIVGAIFLVPVLARPVVVDAVRAASPFGDQPIEVEADVSAFGLLFGRIDRIHVSGSNLTTVEGTAIGRLELVAFGVHAEDRTFQDLNSTLLAVDVPTFDGATIPVDSIGFSGPSGDVEALAKLDAIGGVALIGAAFADAGVAVDGIELVEGGVALALFGQRVEVQLGVDDGALVIPDLLGGGPVVILEPGIDDPWRLTGVVVTRTGITIDAAIDVGGVLERE